MTAVGSLQFGDDELRDLAIAWLALAVAFAIFFGRGVAVLFDPVDAVRLLVVSFLTVGVGFMCHELAHKVVAVRFGQLAAFRADYKMLGLAIVSAMAGFIFAAPGAVHHRGRITKRQHGLIAVAGPWTNLGLAALFAPLVIVPVELVFQIGALGVLINGFLAAFNMIPFGPLDGKTVIGWSVPIWAGTLAVSVVLTVVAFLLFGFPI